MHRVPFTLPEVGLREIKGFVYLNDGYLVLRIQETLLGIADSGEDVFKIEPAALRGLRVKHGWFRDKLVVAPKAMELLEAVPGEHVTSVDLRVARKYRNELEDLVDAFRAMADAQP